MAVIKEESEDIKIEEVFSLKHEDTDAQTDGCSTRTTELSFPREDSLVPSHIKDLFKSDPSLLRVCEDRRPGRSTKDKERQNQNIEDSSDCEDSDGSDFIPSVEDEKTTKDTRSHTAKEVKNTKRKSKKQITIKTSQRNPEGKRIWNKKQFCVFCEKPQSKIARHLERSHSDESEVAKASSFPKRSKKRRILLEQLRNQGNYYHNIKVLETGRGEIITWRQPSAHADVSDFLPCPGCFAFFMKKDLWKHSKTCRGQRDQKKTNGVRVTSVASCLIPAPPQCSAGLRSLLQGMRRDQITETIMKDSLICLYGESLYGKCGHDKSQHQHVVQKMREARFMIEAKSKSKNVKNLTELCKPENFLLTVSTCKKVSNYQPDLNAFKTPSLALKIGYSLKKVCQISLGQCLLAGDRDTEKKLKNFIELIDSHWRTDISSQALNTLQQSRWSEGDGLPLTRDVVALQKHLKSVEQLSKEKLKGNVNGADWTNLAETLLCQIILFNRRRESKASKLLLASYASRSVKPPNEDAVKSLSELEQELCNELTRLETGGKRGRKVPVLLTKDMVESVDLLNGSRREAGVDEGNPYVFAKVGALTHIRGSDCLRKFSKRCGAKDPRSLTSTKLRKQIATLSQVMNLRNGEVEQLARSLGHDIRENDEYYRLSENTAQLGKVCQLLLSLEKGSDCNQGKSLKENNFSTEETENDTSRDLPVHECGTTEEDGFWTEDELSHPVKTVKRKRHVTETDASEDLCTSETVKRCPADDQLMFSGARAPRRPWRRDERDAVKNTLRRSFSLRKVPGKAECQSCLEVNPVLRSRSWVDVKNFVHNTLQSMKQKRASCRKGFNRS